MCQGHGKDHTLQNQLSRDHKGLESLREQLWSLQCLSSILSIEVALLGVFLGLLTVRVFQTLLLALGTIFFLLGCVITHGHEGLCLVLLYLIMMFVDISRRPALSEGKKRNSGSGSVGKLSTREFSRVEAVVRLCERR